MQEQTKKEAEQKVQASVQPVQTPMKYFFLNDSKGKRHIIVANSQESAVEIAQKSGLSIEDAYELLSDTFTTPGFLISDKQPPATNRGLPENYCSKCLACPSLGKPLENGRVPLKNWEPKERGEVS